jgi:hypothetical protein
MSTKWYEDLTSASDIYDANSDTDMPGRRWGNDNLRFP